MSASLVLAGREAGNTDKQCKAAVAAFVESYRQWMRRFSEMAVIDLARFQIYRVVSPVRSVLRKAERATPQNNLQKLTVLQDGKHRFREQKPRQFHIPRAAVRCSDCVAARVRQDAVAPSGALLRAVLSRGCCLPGGGHGQRWPARLRGAHVRLRDFRSDLHPDQGRAEIRLRPLSAVPAAYPRIRASGSSQGQRAMQMQSDIFLGWTSIAGRDYVVTPVARSQGGHRGRRPQGRWAGAIRANGGRAAFQRTRSLRRLLRDLRISRQQ